MAEMNFQMSERTTQYFERGKSLGEQVYEQGLELGRKQGREQGLELGREQGLELGREQGLELGREQGIKQGNEASAKRSIKLMMGYGISESRMLMDLKQIYPDLDDQYIQDAIMEVRKQENKSL